MPKVLDGSQQDQEDSWHFGWRHQICHSNSEYLRKASNSRRANRMLPFNDKASIARRGRQAAVSRCSARHRARRPSGARQHLRFVVDMPAGGCPLPGGARQIDNDKTESGLEELLTELTPWSILTCDYYLMWLLCRAVRIYVVGEAGIAALGGEMGPVRPGDSGSPSPRPPEKAPRRPPTRRLLTTWPVLSSRSRSHSPIVDKNPSASQEKVPVQMDETARIECHCWCQEHRDPGMDVAACCPKHRQQSAASTQ